MYPPAKIFIVVDQQKSSRRDPNHVVDLFAGPGGLDVAAHWLGLHVHGLEWDADACTTRRAAGLLTSEQDVRRSNPTDATFRTAGILAGGPPCQTYTVAGSGSGRKALEQVKTFAVRMEDADPDVADELKELADERTALVLEPLRWILEAHRDKAPFRTVVLEQVPTVRPVWKLYRDMLERLGYSACCGVLNTEEFGVPQTRRRAILIASYDRVVSLPRPTHVRYRKGVPAGDEASRGLKPWVSMGQALRGRAEPFEVVSNYGTGGDPKNRGRRDSSMPAATVTGKIRRNRLLVGEQDAGRFAFDEAGRLQTFPLDYPWAGKDIGQQIGNAIPPRLAVHVLAAALGLHVDEEALDTAVDGEWKRTFAEQPLAGTPAFLQPPARHSSTSAPARDSSVAQATA